VRGVTEAAEEIRLAARGLTLGALRWHNGDARRVLCLHGWLDNAASFMVLAPRLAGCDVVALDLPGHGLSDHRGAVAMPFFLEYVADVAAVLDALGWQDVVLVGHSLGAGVAGYTAAALSSRVSHLVLLEGIGSQTAADHEVPANLRKALADACRTRGEAPSFATVDEAMAVRTRGGFWPLGDAAARHIVTRALAQRADGRHGWRTDPHLRDASVLRLSSGQAAALLGAITAPTLLLCAEQGLLAQQAAHAVRSALVPGLQQQTLPGGHHFHLEPETAPAVAAAVRAFLAG
jgi:pimeloyl-ACP methyl ester carboxylesterase